MFLWNLAKLSFASRIIVATQVLLATKWYVLSCLIFVKSYNLELRRLMRNLLWFGNVEGHAQSKVKWDVTTLPQSKGGFKILLIQ